MGGECATPTTDQTIPKIALATSHPNHMPWMESLSLDAPCLVQLYQMNLLGLVAHIFQSSKEVEVLNFFNMIGLSINNLHVIVNPLCKLYNVNNLSKTSSLCNNLSKPIIFVVNFILGGFLFLRKLPTFLDTANQKSFFPPT